MIDREIREQLFDPRRKAAVMKKRMAKVRAARGKKAYDPKSRQKAWEKELRIKAHAGKRLKGQQKLTGAVSTSKRLLEFAYDIKGVKAWLKKKGIESDLIDVEAEYDHNISHAENLKHFKQLIGQGKQSKHQVPACATMTDLKADIKAAEVKAGIPEMKAELKDAKTQCECTQMGLYDPAPAGKLQGTKHKIIKEGNRYYLFIGANKESYGRYKTHEEAEQAFQEWEHDYDPAPRRQGKPRRWFDAMVKGISQRSDVRNPRAIVASIWSKLSPRKKAEIRKQEKSGHVFKYDLPLPQDMTTRGTGTVRTVKPFNLSEVQANVSGKDYQNLKKSGLYASMRRNDGSIALVKRCKSNHGNCNIFIDRIR